jgi:hypothetical protein
MPSRHRRSESGQRAFLRRILNDGARRLDVSIVPGEAVFGWHDRTIGAAVTMDGDRHWLRATAEHRDWACGEAWTGNQDALAIRDVPKPELIARAQWDEDAVCIYAELLTYVSEQPCSATPELITPMELPASWWADLSAAIDTLAAHPTPRGDHDPWAPVQRITAFYGRAPDLDQTPALRTEHTDLHWANLTHPGLCILDWEYWGSALTGYGVAVLYLHSLLVPTIASQVHARFADVLDTPTGRLAQLSAAAHILDRATRSGDYPVLADPVRAHSEQLLESVGIR